TMSGLGGITDIQARVMRVTYLSKRWAHHTRSGGYDRLASAVGGAVISRRPVNSLLARAANRLWVTRTATHSYLMDYQFGDLLAELSVLGSALIRPPTLVHVLYGDEQLDLLLRYRRLLRCPL